MTVRLMRIAHCLAKDRACEIYIYMDVPTTDLLHFYTTVVRPVLEYACPVWHSGLTVAQSDLLEYMQKRAICIVYPNAAY